MAAIPFYKSVYGTHFLAGGSWRSRSKHYRAMAGATVNYGLSSLFVFTEDPSGKLSHFDLKKHSVSKVTIFHYKMLKPELIKTCLKSQTRSSFLGEDRKWKNQALWSSRRAEGKVCHFQRRGGYP